MTLEERCKLSTDCLPQAEYRLRLEALHAELLAAAVHGQAGESEFSGPNKWTAEEIADGYRGIRWITTHGVHGRPTESDLRRWLAQNPMCKDPAKAVMTAGD